MKHLQAQIERLFAQGGLEQDVEQDKEAREVFVEFRNALTAGKIRAAEKKGDRWVVNAWVKQGILLGFRLGQLTDMGDSTLSFALTGPVASAIGVQTTLRPDRQAGASQRGGANRRRVGAGERDAGGH